MARRAPVVIDGVRFYGGLLEDRYNKKIDHIHFFLDGRWGSTIVTIGQ